MDNTSTGHRPKTQKAARAGATFANQVQTLQHPHDTPQPLKVQDLGLAGLIGAHRDAAMAHTLAGLNGNDAGSVAESALGAYFARRAEALALLVGGSV